MIDLEKVGFVVTLVLIVAVFLWAIVYGSYLIHETAEPQTPQPITLTCDVWTIHPRASGGYVMTITCPAEK